MIHAALGAALALALTTTGSAIGSAYGGQIAVLQRAHGGSLAAFMPIIIAGVIGIYGMIVAVIIVSRIGGGESPMSEDEGNRLLAAGLTVGVPGLVSGSSIGVFCRYLLSTHDKMSKFTVSPAGYRRMAIEREVGDDIEPENGSSDSAAQLVNGTIFLVLAFIEALALYGLIAALLLISKYDKAT